MMEKLSAEEFDANYQAVLERLDKALKKSHRQREEVTLLAATKTVDPDTVNYAISKGITHIGENKVQELLSKDDAITHCHRHFIGHLQTNKVRDVIGRVEMIESVDSFKLAKTISVQAQKIGKTMEILLEVNIGGEEAKWGFSPDELLDAVLEVAQLPAIKIRGLMAIPPVCENSEDSRKYFSKMKKLFIDIGAQNIDNSSMDILSMGMSDDFDIAVEEGANLIRLGTALFGRRIYNL